MQLKKNPLFLGLLTLGASVAVAHHVEVALSHLQGAEALDSVVFHVQSGNFGIPHYRLSVVEFDHHHEFDFDHGDRFIVSDGSGATETIVLEAQDFIGGMGGDIDHVHMHDLVDVVNDKSSLIELSEQNEKLVVQGLVGGAAAAINLVDDQGGPLSKLTVAPGVGFGADNLDMVVSVPSESGLNLPGQPYFTLVSATPGTFGFGGKDIPLAFDSLSANAFLLAAAGQLPGFFGVLNGNSDAAFQINGQLFSNVQAGAKLYLAYVVMSNDLSQVDFVSNPFTINYQ
jgi:hypothetical protein